MYVYLYDMYLYIQTLSHTHPFFLYLKPIILKHQVSVGPVHRALIPSIHSGLPSSTKYSSCFQDEGTEVQKGKAVIHTNGDANQIPCVCRSL